VLSIPFFGGLTLAGAFYLPPPSPSSFAHYESGVLEDAPLNNDEISGTPPGAQRYCPIHLIRKLVQGLTLVLFDHLSGRTRAIVVEGKQRLVVLSQ